MVSIIPYLSVSNAVEAGELYKNIFNSEMVEHMPVAEEMAKDWGIPEGTDLTKTTMHSSYKIGDALFFMADNFQNPKSEHPNISMLVVPDSKEQGEEFFKRAKENGCEITSEFTKEFWGDYFGSFTDPYGILWQVNYSEAQE